MRFRAALACLLLLTLVANVAAQQPAPSSSPTPAPPQQPPIVPADEEVVRITANLVQMDLVVTDKHGKQVTDLQPSDFELLEDGRPQQITHFSYINNEPAATLAPTPTPPPDKNAPPAPPVRLRPEQVRRTIALVVDDLGLSFESTNYMRDSLRKFVERQMQPNDLVAIIRTSAGIGALQQFTGDRRQLLAAIERIKWSPSFRGGISPFAPISSDPAASPVGRSITQTLPADRNAADELDALREDLFAVGTLGALNFVVRGMRELPGRKSVILFSEGFQLYRNNESNTRVLTALQRLTDLANRASVVIYTIDARGLVVYGPTAADDTSGLSPQQLEAQLSNRRNLLFDTQSSLSYLAQQTGGFAIRNSNDLTGGVRRVLEDQKGYYLIGYRPGGETFNRRFHRLTARLVGRKDLKVRTRIGFYGVADEDLHPARRTRNEQLYAALASPFAAADVHLRLTALFANDAQAGSFMRAVLYVDANDLTFTQEADGQHKTEFDMVAVTFGDNGQAIGEAARTYTFTLREDVYQKALKGGINYSLNVPIKKGGAYQLRMAVRDAATERVGSASQFIEVPDINKKRLVLSGLVVSGVSAAQAKAEQAATGGAGVAPNAAATAEGALDEPDPLAGPAVRRVRRTSFLDYAYVIYNAQIAKPTGLPQLTAQARLFRDGQEVYTGAPQPIKLVPQPDLRRIGIVGRLLLGTDLAPGEYILQVVVTDELADHKHRTATQWSDFELVK
jgi:VWFA-related protein